MTYFSGVRIWNKAVSAITADKPPIMVLAEVDDSIDVELSDRTVEDSPYDSSDRASQLKGLIELDSHDCISASAN